MALSGAIFSWIDRTVVAYTRLIVCLRWPVILITLVLSVALMLQASQLEIQSDYRYMFAPQDPYMLAVEEIENEFTKIDSSILLLTPQDRGLDDPEFLKLLHELTERLWQMPYTTRVDSIANYQYVRAEGDDLVVSDLIEDPESLTQEQADEIIRIAASKIELKRRLINTSTNTTGINVRAYLKAGDNKGFKEATLFIEDIADEIRQRYPNIRVEITGLVPRGYAFYKIPIQDMSLMVPMMLGILWIVMMLLTRSLYSPLVALTLVGLTAGAAMGIGGLLSIPISTISALAPVVILTISITSSIHIIMSYLIGIQSGKEKHQALIDSLRVNAQPVFLATLTTCIGFLSLNFSDSPPFRDLGNLSAIGTTYGWMMAMSFLPAMLAVVPIRPSAWIDRQGTGIDRAADIILRYRNKLLSIIAIAGLISALLIPRLEFSENFVTYFGKDTAPTRGLVYLMDNLSGVFQFSYAAKSGEANGIYDPKYMKELERMTDWLREQPEVLSVGSFTDTLKNLNQAMHGDDPAYYRIPQDRELIAQYILLYELSLPYGLDLNDQINTDRSATRMDIATQGLRTPEYMALADEVQQWVDTQLPAEMQSPVSSMSLLFSMLGIKNFRAMQVTTVIAFLLISLSIAVALRSVRLGVISIFPNTVPILLFFGGFSLTGLPLQVWAAFVIPTALGLIVDATVHFLSKYKFASDELDKTPEQAIRYVFSTVGMALWVSTLVLVLGFAILFFSDITTMKYLGTGAAGIIIMSLFVVFLMLPALLILSEKIQLTSRKP